MEVEEESLSHDQNLPYAQELKTVVLVQKSDK